MCCRMSSLDDNESMSSGDTTVTTACLQKLPPGGVASVGTNPPLTPKTQRKGAPPNTAPTGHQTLVPKSSNFAPSYATGHCECENAANAYSNYDIPKSNPVKVDHPSPPVNPEQSAYDTPKSLNRDQLAFTNYDFPHEQPVPIFRKPCGCIMKFNGGAPPTAQSSASNGGPKVVPKMKLTGCGKMPVVDMRGPEHNVPTNSETVQLQVTAPQPNATSSPVYAVVNKANKRKLKTESAPTPQPFPNYCNVEVGLTGKPPICPPREPYYENSRQVVSRMKQPALPVGGSMPNYEEMDPKKLSCVGATPRPPSGDILPNYEEMEPLAHKLNHQLTMQPATSGGGGCGDYTEMQPHRSSLVQTVIPFEPNGIAGAMADCHQETDQINSRLREMAESLDDPSVNRYTKTASAPESPEILGERQITQDHGGDERNSEVGSSKPQAIPSQEWCVTMPRTSYTGQSHHFSSREVRLRRSSSVPCNRVARGGASARGSTSSSDDSGFSPGYPGSPNRQSVNNIKSAVVRAQNSATND